MPIYSSAGNPAYDKPFVPCPAGVYPAVCVDVVDEGVKLSPFKDKDGNAKMVHKISLVWQVSKLMENGKRFSIRAWFTNSLYSGNGKKAKLRDTLDSWGIELTDAQGLGAEPFDLESLIGLPCLLNVVHNKSQDGTKTYANVGSIMPLPDGMPRLEPLDYQRKGSPASDQSIDDFAHPAIEDSIPF